MDLGLLLGFEDSLDTLLNLAREGEAAGLAGMYNAEAGRSAFVPATAIASVTERLRVGTYVVNAYAREPWATGISARDLDEFSDGRFVLGVGTGNLHFNDWYMNLDSSKPLAKMRDYVSILRSVVAGRAGESVRHDGEAHRIRWRASWPPTRSSIPVYLSASGPNMVRLAGEVADGVAVGVMTSTEFLREHVRPGARAGAEAAGRDPNALAFPMGALVSVNRDAALAREAVRASICSLFHPVPHPYYSSQLHQLGFGDFADQAAELMRSGREKEAMSRVPEPVVEAMTIAGTPAECAARIREYEGLADEVIALRVAQPDDPPGVAAYDDFFELASLVA